MQVDETMHQLQPLVDVLAASSQSWLEVIQAADIANWADESAVGTTARAVTALPWRAPTVTSTLLVPGMTDTQIAQSVMAWLTRFYPAEHTAYLLHAGMSPSSSAWPVPLSELATADELGDHAVLVVPPLAENDNVRTFSGLMHLTRRLRGPGGCPWDREQTNASLKPYLLEEAYEVLDALDGDEPRLVAEEMGDLLYQIAIHSQVAAEAGTFTIEDVLENVIRKLIGRHPHVFEDMELESAQDVRQAWESLKQKQKPKRASILEEIPRGLPALPQSNLMQKRAASVGFEWPSISDVLDKVEEEITELRAEIAQDGMKERCLEELGDVFFSLVSVARHLRIDPEEALRLANRKFATRFSRVEAEAAVLGRSVRDLSPEELDAAWNQAKAAVTEAQ